jgi:perosamine synthetase
MSDKSNKHKPLPNQIIDAIFSVVGDNPVYLHEPTFSGNEWAYVKECIDSTYVSSVGKFVNQFEEDLATLTGAEHVVAVVNGTAALHISLMLAGVKANDEVLLPSLTFVATANAVSYCKALPHFVDSEEISLGIDSSKLREYLQSNTEQINDQCVNIATGNVIRAMVPMHTFGHPSNIDGLLSVAHDFNLVMVEDAAESLGSMYHGKHTGTFGLLGTLSFNGNKTITTGGGGAILTNDSEIARRAKHISTTAKLPHKWEFIHDEIGYNYRLPNINAALGCAQLEQLPDKIANKRKLYNKYKDAFTSIKGLKIVSEPKNCNSNYWLQTLMLNKENAHNRDAILQATNEAGIMTRPVWQLMHYLKPYSGCSRMDLSVAESISERLINIPSSPSLVD